jgi:hypothetical protein
MELKKAMQMIGAGWIQRPRGFRVRFERRQGEQLVSDFFPSETETLLSSDVMAWELARRFAEATGKGATGEAEGAITSITVVDDKGSPVRFYGTNTIRVLNPRAQD